jgi:hypothetical protein
MHMRLGAQRFDFLFQRVSPASLGLLRIAFGVLMTWQFPYMREYMVDIMANSKFFITYDYLHWIKPTSPENMAQILQVGMVGAIFVLLGLFHRAASALVLGLWLYVFLVCRGHYTNHYYLFGLVGFWLMVSDANRWGSLDRLIYKYVPWTRGWILGFGGDVDTVPYWQVLAFKVQLFVVYFYGGIAKISVDWLSGYPMRIWLPNKPWLPSIMHEVWFAVWMSWSGMLFDLLIGFVLLSRYRKWALPFVIFFHVSNEFIFRTIGGFPHFMLAATLIFFDPAWPADALAWLKRNLIKPTPPAPATKGKSKARTAATADAPPASQPVKAIARPVVLTFFALFWSWQFLYPLRHYLYPGDPSITGEGGVFAWRMMLTARDYGAKFKVVVNGETFYITGESLFHYMNFRQFTRLCRSPKSFQRFAYYIRDEMRKTDPTLDPEIYGYLIVQYNARNYAHVIDTTVNLVGVPYNHVVHTDWLRTEDFEEPAGSRYQTESPIRD